MRSNYHGRIGAPVEKPQADDDLPTVEQSLGVLVVDDDRLVSIMVQMALEREGFDVWLAKNGHEAIELYQKERENISVVLLDVHMPVLNGPSTLDTLRALNPGVVACFMSGDMGADKADELIGRGAEYVIDKPFSMKQLAHTLRLLAVGVPAERLWSGNGCASRK
ncbi:MAG TPA: response regulator [Gemmataceae bacterium]|nr:response regulator [Gemmataceae bacterium]